MISKRQEEILKVIVQEYTKTATPVGSKRILELMKHPVSGATIRYEGVALENLGLLEKQYTSSGRVPSSKGYRYYVDNLMDGYVDRKVFKQIEALFANRSKSIDAIINESTQMISDLTNLIVVVSKKDLETNLKIRHIELIPIDLKTATVIFILNNGEVFKKTYRLNEESLTDLKIAIDLFNDNLVDTPIDELVEKSKSLEKVIGKAVQEYDSFFEQLLSTLTEELGEKNAVYGVKNVLVNPEFSDHKRIERVLSLIENISPFDWFNYSYQKSKNDLAIETKIGDEFKNLTDVNDLSMVTSDFSINEGQINAITLIGPKRMNYDQANVLLRFLIDQINGFRK